MNKIINLSIFTLFVVIVASGASGTFDNAYAGSYDYKHNDAYLHILDLTDEEITWIENNNQVNVVYSPSWAPFEYINSQNQISGLTPQFVYQFEKLTGLDFVFVDNISSWDGALHALQNRSGDVEFFIVENNIRSLYLDFTSTHTIVSTNIITTGSELLTMDDLSELKVGTTKGHAIEAWLDENYPEVEYISLKNVDKALAWLEFGKLDVYLDSYQVAKYNERKVINTATYLFNAGETGYNYDLGIGYRSDQPLLGSILQKALDSVVVTESSVSLIEYQDHTNKYSKVKSSAFTDDNTLPPACVRCDADPVTQHQDGTISSQALITLWNDNPDYKRGDVININGYLANNYNPNTPTITYKVTDTANNIVEVGQTEVNRDRTFMITLNTAGVMWNNDGAYKLKVYYGATSNIDNFTYIYITNNGFINSDQIIVDKPDVDEKQVPELIYNDNSLAIKTDLARCITISDQDDVPIGQACMNAILFNGNINSMNIDEDANSIVFDVNLVTGDKIPSLEIILRDNFMKGEFIVLLDDQEWKDVVISVNDGIDDPKTMILISNIPNTTQKIEVVGSYVIPEFGNIAMMVLAVAIISIVAVTAKSRVVPRL